MDKNKKRKMEVAVELVEKGDFAVIEKIIEFDEKVEEVIADAKDFQSAIIENINDFEQKVSKKIVNIQKGDPGDSYVLTDKDKQDIADSITITDEDIEAIAKSVPVKYIPKIVERVETIKEVPMVTNQIVEKTVEKIDKTETGETIVEKINALPTDTDEFKIGAEHIKGLIDTIAELRSQIKNSSTPAGGVVGRSVFKDIDLSADLDGSTKTFNIPSVYNILNVNLSSFPYGSLRKNIDFTYTSNSITFTDEIDAATQLSAGQACVLTVVTN